MARKTKKTDQTKPWNRRSGAASAYKLASREIINKRFLIVCEGKNTEPCYFQSFPVQTAEVKTYGLGRSKMSLVEYAIQLVNQEPQKDQEVWIVFDMDVNHLKDMALQRKDFNDAVHLAREHKFQVAYSNDAFELWFLLHYQLLESALTRLQYYERISQHWGLSYERECKGQKFSQSVYHRLLNDPNSSQENAIRNAERLHKQSEHLTPADQNPCTTVYMLVQELNKYLKK
ncbi:MAG: RloB domain-containing protein [Saprospiraceae bacterium]|nr:RloB domain-containing protein [Saprospiraceae bacterium]